MTTAVDYNFTLTYQAGQEPGGRVFSTVAGPAIGAGYSSAQNSSSGSDHLDDRTVPVALRQGVLALLTKNELIQIILRIL
jgi:hypothetical protein